MFSAQRKIAALGLVLLLAIPLIFFVFFFVQQKVLQISSRDKFSTEIIQTISVSGKNINWIKKGKEIIIGGKFFDVKSYITEGENILLTGYYDHKEDKLVNHIRKVFQQKNESGSPIDQIALKFLFFPVFNTTAEITIEGTWSLTSQKFFSYTEKIPEAPYLTFNPPPEL